jgi:hypothetical protein
MYSDCHNSELRIKYPVACNMVLCYWAVKINVLQVSLVQQVPEQWSLCSFWNLTRKSKPIVTIYPMNTSSNSGIGQIGQASECFTLQGYSRSCIWYIGLKLSIGSVQTWNLHHAKFQTCATIIFKSGQGVQRNRVNDPWKVASPL